MLELTEKEWAALQAADEANYILAILDDIKRDYPWLANDLQLAQRIKAAYAEAIRIGMTSDDHIVRFMYSEATAPSFYKKPAISAWLGKKGVAPEQRFDMLLDVARVRLREKREGA